jgi:tetratricopeptide (TPR) repeat protein
MGLLRRKESYDRSRLLNQAARARRRGNLKKAVELYRRVLVVEPRNAELHRRMAPLLARTKKPDESLKSYRLAAGELIRGGFIEQAIGVYREALQQLPPQRELFIALSDLELERGRKPDAIDALLEGRKKFRRRRDRSDATVLLLRVRKLDPHHLDAALDLAVILAKTGQRNQALRLLDEQAARRRGPELRRVRARSFRLAPNFGTGLRWMQALFRGT